MLKLIDDKTEFIVFKSKHEPGQCKLMNAILRKSVSKAGLL